MTHSLALDIAGMTIALEAEADLPIAAEGAARKFVCAASRPEVRIRARWGAPRESLPADLLFDSGKGLWRLYRAGRGRRFVFTSGAFGPTPYQAASFNEEFTEGDIEVSRPIFADRLPLYPLHYPLDELLVVHLLAGGRGVEIHGSGVVSPDGRGTLFVGQSGAGKTTMARLWRSEPDITILSDERIVLRQEGAEVWMYGTPWHGDGHISNPGRARLGRIVFLRHGTRNELAPVPRTQAIARLFSCSFTPFHDPAGLGYTLEFLERVVAHSPCDELGFVPDRSAVDFLLNG